MNEDRQHLKTEVRVDSLWQLVDKMVDVLKGDDKLVKIEANFHGMVVQVQLLGPARIQIDLLE